MGKWWRGDAELSCNLVTVKAVGQDQRKISQVLAVPNSTRYELGNLSDFGKTPGRCLVNHF